MRERAADGQGVDVDIIALASLSESERSLWRSWCASGALSPFHRLEFAEIAAQIAPDAALAVLHRKGAPCGFFPFQRRGGAAYPLGAPLNDYHSVVAPPDETWDPAALSHSLGVARVGVTGWVGPASARQGARRAALVADLTDGWEAYALGRRARFGKFFRDKERGRRALVRDAGPVEFEGDCDDEASLDALIALKRAQYGRTGKHDVFACGWTEDLLKSLWRARGPHFGARLAVLHAGGRTWAMELSLHADAHYHFWIPAYDRVGARYAPGLLLCIDTLQAASAEGFRTFDFGFEGQAYKKYFADPAAEVSHGLVFARGRPRWRDALSSALGPDLVAKVEHRWLAIEACETTRLRRWRTLAAAVARAPFN
ncbi:GNAT family N-acetyltransferase [Phenylobacterium sp.]|uniref:GNAT family N-acetyltransferase n=1 Tax=Phenylobacterium sp. TaxID=1871053 RepID=UPI00289DBF5A|nr:GNAT family N-acetyltransferase [Phenylobacterium sp.]